MKIGVLGAGQLGRMLTEAALRLDIEMRMIDSGSAARTTPFMGRVIGSPENESLLAEFLDGLDALTFETENISPQLIDSLDDKVTLRPGSKAIKTAQDRLREKELAQELKLATPRWLASSSPAELEASIAAIGWPAVVKTRRDGFDGRGQAVIRDFRTQAKAVADFGERECIVEEWVPFKRELARAGARGVDGEIRIYDLTQTTQIDGMLAYAQAPVMDSDLDNQTRDILTRAMKALDYVGTMAIEFFDTGSGVTLNEIAPRVHNSAHWTQDGARTCQFENHLRAVAGLPLGATYTLEPTLSVNVVGSNPDLAPLLRRFPEANVHMYGKTSRPKRKLGHVNLPISGRDVDELIAEVNTLLT